MDVWDILAKKGEVQRLAKIYVDSRARMEAEREKLTKAKNLDAALKKAVTSRDKAAAELEAAEADANKMRAEAEEYSQDKYVAADRLLKEAKEKEGMSRKTARETDRDREALAAEKATFATRKEKLDAEIAAWEARQAKIAAL